MVSARAGTANFLDFACSAATSGCVERSSKQRMKNSVQANGHVTRRAESITWGDPARASPVSHAFIAWDVHGGSAVQRRRRSFLWPLTSFLWGSILPDQTRTLPRVVFLLLGGGCAGTAAAPSSPA